MAATATSATPALPAASGDVNRPRNTLATGVALTCAGATMFFGALLGAYLHLRGQGGRWVPEGVEFDNYLGNMLMITVLLASLAAQWAVSAVKRGEARQATAALGVSIGIGLAFFNLLWYTASLQHYDPGSHAYGAVVIALGASLTIVVLLAVGFAALTMLRVRGGQVSAGNPDQVWATAWFWHFASVATLIVWYVVVVRK
jgi:heme/copper-type cytochrome/quinol oxidase subunit 3